jgi:hypothetical protein
MATHVGVDVFLDKDEIHVRRFREHGDPFSTLDLVDGGSAVRVFVSDRPVLDALQAALDTIRADMDAADAADAAASDFHPAAVA